MSADIKRNVLLPPQPESFGEHGQRKELQRTFNTIPPVCIDLTAEQASEYLDELSCNPDRVSTEDVSEAS